MPTGTRLRRPRAGTLPALAAELRGESIEALGALAEGVLSTTEATYRALLGHLAQRELGRTLGDVRGRDLPRLLRGGDDPGAPPPSHVAREALAALAALGLDLSRLGVTLDLDSRPGKDPRALAFPIEVPKDVRISFAPSGTPGELRALLHELGAAAFYARITTPVLEFRRLGNVTAATWAALAEDLASEPAWLADRTGRTVSEVAPMVRRRRAPAHAVRSLAACVLARRPRGCAPTAKAEAILARSARPVRRTSPLSPCASSRRAACSAPPCLRAAWAFLAGRSAALCPIQGAASGWPPRSPRDRGSTPGLAQVP
jgi:hypothetical protein